MSNFSIYAKTLRFSFWRILFSFLALIVAIALPVGTFLLVSAVAPANDTAIAVSTLVAAILGLIVLWLVSRYLGYLLTAGQIAMMTEGVTKGELPDDVLAAGKAAVKKRFVTANVYFGLRSLINGVTHEISRGLTAVSSALGGLTGGSDGANIGGAIGSAISGVIAVMLEYVNYCCLGWVFRNENQNAFKSTCDGAVIYFQNWKVLLKNTAKIIAICLVSFIVLGLPLMYLSGVVMQQNGGVMALLTAMAEQGADVTVEGDPEMFLYIAAVIVGGILWAIIHGALVKPYIIVSVLRKYVESAEQNPPKVDVYGKLCGMSKKFKKAFDKSGEPAAEAV